MHADTPTAALAARSTHWLVHESADAQAQAQALAQDLAARLQSTVAARGQALLAVSGGRSPVALFTQLRQQPVDWARVTVLLVDERCVPTDHPDSNAALVQRHLLQGAAAAARFVPFFEQLPGWAPARDWSERELDALTQLAETRVAGLAWPLDVALLGMGEDGHTASLFPAAPGLDQALASDHRLAWTRPATAPHARLTLTLSALLSARALVLPLQGAAKRAVFDRACRATTRELPVSLVLHQSPRPVQVWLAP